MSEDNVVRLILASRGGGDDGSDDGRSDGPHLSGEFVCGACLHEWTGVTAVGSAGHCECPRCHRWWGSAKHMVVPETFWRCTCGETQFWLTPTGAMCRRCGVRSNDWAE